MPLVPVLLRLADLLGTPAMWNQSSLTQRHQGMDPPSEDPLVEAWNICQKCDGLLAQWDTSRRIFSCSQQTQVVMYQVLRRNAESGYPCRYDLGLLIEQGEQFSMSSRIKRYFPLAAFYLVVESISIPRLCSDLFCFCFFWVFPSKSCI